LIQLAIAVGGGTLLHRFVIAPDQDSSHFRLECYYLLIIGFELFQLFFVLYGIRKTQTSMANLISGQWASIGSVVKDLFIGLAFWFLCLIVISVVTKAFGLHLQPSSDVRAMLPRTGTEIVLWMVLSVSAGFSEEVVYRGYLQRQFLALGKNLPLAIVGQAIVFGLIHSYQGLGHVLAISVMGALFGLLAVWRKSLRPGIIAHMWIDGFTGTVAYLLRN
ncbi:MAG TPA: type II CAAX endopeptidase family protein, partial [Lacipirellulaceae bacterium]|nr:type II CAAX endopeptidase family protein [Lacipirellulaceae bacterium]